MEVLSGAQGQSAWCSRKHTSVLIIYVHGGPISPNVDDEERRNHAVRGPYVVHPLS